MTREAADIESISAEQVESETDRPLRLGALAESEQIGVEAQLHFNWI